MVDLSAWEGEDGEDRVKDEKEVRDGRGQGVEGYRLQAVWTSCKTWSVRSSQVQKRSRRTNPSSTSNALHFLM